MHLGLVPAFLFVACACAASARAQSTFNFDSLPEGFAGTTLVTPVGTFQDLILDNAGTQGQFVIEETNAVFGASYTSSLPNLLSVGAFAPGPAHQVTQFKSFRLLLPHAVSSIRLQRYQPYYRRGHVLHARHVQRFERHPSLVVAVGADASRSITR